MKKRKDYFDILLILFFISRLFTNIFVGILGKKGIFLSMGILLVLYIVAVIIGFKQGKKKYILYFLSVFLAISALAMFTGIINPDIRIWLLSFSQGILVKVFDPRKAIFALLLILLVGDPKKIKENILTASYINAVYYVIQMLLFYRNGNWDAYFMTISDTSTSAEMIQYNMALSYDLIFLSIVMLYAFFKTEKIHQLIIAAISFTWAFNYGSRGVLIVLLGFLFLVFVFDLFREKRENLIKRNIIKLLAIVAAIIITMLLFRPIANIFYKTLNIEYKKGISTLEEFESRNTEMLKGGDFLKDKARNSIWEISYNNFKLSPIIGHGLYGDRPVVGDRYKWGYSHNIVLEIMNFFGIFGIALLAYIAFLCFKELLEKENNDRKILIIIFGSMCIKLLLSDSFIQYSFFYALIGVLLLDKDIFKKHLLKIVLALLALNIILFPLFIREEIKNMHRKPIIIEKPMASVNIDYNGKEDRIKKLIKNNIRGTLFIEIDKIEDKSLNKEFIEYLIKNNWSFGLLINGDESKETIIEQIDKFKEFLEKNNLQKDIYLGTKKINLEPENDSIKNKVSFVKNTGTKSWGYTDAKINTRAFYKLDSFILDYNIMPIETKITKNRVEVEHKDIEEKINRYKYYMEIIRNEKKLIFYTIKEIDKLDDKYFDEIVKELKTVATINFDELNQMSKRKEKPGIKNYIKYRFVESLQEITD